jgi:hypothetical protein
MSYRSLGSDEVTLRNYRPVGRRKGNMSLSDPLAAGVVVDLHKPGLSGIGIRLPRRRLIFCRYFIKKTVCRNLQSQPPVASRFGWFAQQSPPSAGLQGKKLAAIRIAFHSSRWGDGLPSPWGTCTSYSLPASWRTPLRVKTRPPVQCSDVSFRRVQT